MQPVIKPDETLTLKTSVKYSKGSWVEMIQSCGFNLKMYESLSFTSHRIQEQLYIKGLTNEASAGVHNEVNYPSLIINEA